MDRRAPALIGMFGAVFLAVEAGHLVRLQALQRQVDHLARQQPVVRTVDLPAEDAVPAPGPNAPAPATPGDDRQGERDDQEHPRPRLPEAATPADDRQVERVVRRVLAEVEAARKRDVFHTLLPNSGWSQILMSQPHSVQVEYRPLSLLLARKGLGEALVFAESEIDGLTRRWGLDDGQKERIGLMLQARDRELEAMEPYQEGQPEYYQERAAAIRSHYDALIQASLTGEQRARSAEGTPAIR